MNKQKVQKSLGQELIEYAITLPIFLILVLGIVDLGRAVYYYSAMNNVVREGARYGSIHLENTNIDTEICNMIIQRAIGVSLDCSDVTTNIDLNTGTIEVTVTYRFVLVSQIISGFFGVNDLQLTTSSIMQLEYIPIS